MRYPEAAIAAYFGSQQAGSNVWLHKSITGLTPQKYTSAQRETLKNLGMSYYTTVNGTPTLEGASKTPFGEWIDVEVFTHWLKATLQEQVFNYLINTKKVKFEQNDATAIGSIVKGVLKVGVLVGGLEGTYEVNIPNILQFSPLQRNTRNLPDITFRARLSGAIVYIDGILGTLSS